ncbi:hypothetical protein HK096_009182, partial [Nowakowskiella sp. JEL0078]
FGSLEMLNKLAILNLLDTVFGGWGWPLVVAGRSKRWDVLMEIALKFFFPDKSLKGRWWGEAIAHSALHERDESKILLNIGIDRLNYMEAQRGFNAAMNLCIEYGLLDFAKSILCQMSKFWETENSQWHLLTMKACLTYGPKNLEIFRELILRLVSDHRLNSSKFIEIHSVLLLSESIPQSHKLLVSQIMLQHIPKIRENLIESSAEHGNLETLKMLTDESSSITHNLKKFSSSMSKHDLLDFWYSIIKIATESKVSMDAVSTVQFIIDQVGIENRIIGFWRIDEMRTIWSTMSGILSNQRYPTNDTRNKLIQIFIEFTSKKKEINHLLTTILDNDVPLELSKLLENYAKTNGHFSRDSIEMEPTLPILNTLLNGIVKKDSNGQELVPDNTVEILTNSLILFTLNGQFESVDRLCMLKINPLLAPIEKLESLTKELKKIINLKYPGGCKELNDLLQILKWKIGESRQERIGGDSMTQIRNVKPHVKALLRNPLLIRNSFVILGAFIAYLESQKSEQTLDNNNFFFRGVCPTWHSIEKTTFRILTSNPKSLVSKSSLGGCLLWDSILMGKNHNVTKLLALGADPRNTPTSYIIRGIALLSVNEPKIVWTDIKCDQCNKLNFNGIRYKCLVCKNIDFCSNCYPIQVGHEHPHLSEPGDRFAKLTCPLNSWKTETCNGCSVLSFPGTKYSCTVCDKFILCENCHIRYQEGKNFTKPISGWNKHLASHKMNTHKVPKTLQDVFGVSYIECCNEKVSCTHENSVRQFISILATSFLGSQLSRFDSPDSISIKVLHEICILVTNCIRNMHWLQDRSEWKMLKNACESKPEMNTNTVLGCMDIEPFEYNEIMTFATNGILRCIKKTDTPICSTVLSTLTVEALIDGNLSLFDKLMKQTGLELNYVADHETIRSIPTRITLGKAIYRLREISRLYSPAKGAKVIIDVYSGFYQLFAWEKKLEVNEQDNILPPNFNELSYNKLNSAVRLIKWSSMLPDYGYSKSQLSVMSLETHKPPPKLQPEIQDISKFLNECGVKFTEFDAPLLASIMLRCTVLGDLNSMKKICNFTNIDLTKASSDEVVSFMRIFVIRLSSDWLADLPQIVRAIVGAKAIETLTIIAPASPEDTGEVPTLKVVNDETVQKFVINELLFHAAQHGDTPLVRAILLGLVDAHSTSKVINLNLSKPENTKRSLHGYISVNLTSVVRQLSEKAADKYIHPFVKVALNNGFYETALEFLNYGFTLKEINAETVEKLFKAAELKYHEAEIIKPARISCPKVVSKCFALLLKNIKKHAVKPFDNISVTTTVCCNFEQPPSNSQTELFGHPIPSDEEETAIQLWELILAKLKQYFEYSQNPDHTKVVICAIYEWYQTAINESEMRNSSVFSMEIPISFDVKLREIAQSSSDRHTKEEQNKLLKAFPNAAILRNQTVTSSFDISTRSQSIVFMDTSSIGVSSELITTTTVIRKDPVADLLWGDFTWNFIHSVIDKPEFVKLVIDVGLGCEGSPVCKCGKSKVEELATFLKYWFVFNHAEKLPEEIPKLGVIEDNVVIGGQGWEENDLKLFKEILVQKQNDVPIELKSFENARWLTLDSNYGPQHELFEKLKKFRKLWV